MYKSFFKTTLTICFLSIFPVSCAIAMDDEDKKTNITTPKIEPNNADSTLTQEEEKCCSQPCWGVYRWVYGIKEYIIDRCLLGEEGFNYQDPERVYVSRHETGPGQFNIITSTDCCCCNSHAINPNPDRFCLTLCCPCVSLCHLLYLPRRCCECSPQQRIYTYTLADRNRDEDRRRADEEKLRAYMEERDARHARGEWSSYSYSSGSD